MQAAGVGSSRRGPRSSVAIIVHTLLTQTGLTFGREVKLVKRLIVASEKLGEVRDEPHRGRIGPAKTATGCVASKTSS